MPCTTNTRSASFHVYLGYVNLLERIRVTLVVIPRDNADRATLDSGKGPKAKGQKPLLRSAIQLLSKEGLVNTIFGVNC